MIVRIALFAVAIATAAEGFYFVSGALVLCAFWAAVLGH